MELNDAKLRPLGAISLHFLIILPLNSEEQ